MSSLDLQDVADELMELANMQYKSQKTQQSVKELIDLTYQIINNYKDVAQNVPCNAVSTQVKCGLISGDRRGCTWENETCTETTPTPPQQTRQPPPPSPVAVQPQQPPPPSPVDVPPQQPPPPSPVAVPPQQPPPPSPVAVQPQQPPPPPPPPPPPKRQDPAAAAATAPTAAAPPAAPPPPPPPPPRHAVEEEESDGREEQKNEDDGSNEATQKNASPATAKPASFLDGIGQGQKNLRPIEVTEQERQQKQDKNKKNTQTSSQQTQQTGSLSDVLQRAMDKRRGVVRGSDDDEDDNQGVDYWSGGGWKVGRKAEMAMKSRRGALRMKGGMKRRGDKCVVCSRAMQRGDAAVARGGHIYHENCYLYA